MSDFFPFYQLGYECNPFRSLTPAEWAEIAVVPAGLLTRARGGGHLQVIGRKGRGKTSTLLGLAAALEADGKRVTYERVPQGQHHLRTDPNNADVLLLDEVQRLAPRHRWRLVGLHTTHHLILGTHLTYQPDFWLRGARLHTHQVGGHTREHTRRIIEARLAYFARAHPPTLTLSEGAIAATHARFGSDLRAATFWLYDVFQQAAAEGLTGSLTPQQVKRLGG